MQTNRSAGNGFRERFQWGSYGFLPGLLLGIVLGWIFSGLVSWIFRIGIALLILIPLVALFFLWRWWTTRDDARMVVYEYSNRRPDLASDDVIDSRSRVVDVPNGSPDR